MSTGLIKAFESVTDWTELNYFQETHYGYITREHIQDGGDAYFLWKPDEEPIKLESMFMGGATFVRFQNSNH
jgi:hypothetical protein